MGVGRAQKGPDWARRDPAQARTAYLVTSKCVTGICLGGWDSAGRPPRSPSAHAGAPAPVLEQRLTFRELEARLDVMSPGRSRMRKRASPAIVSAAFAGTAGKSATTVTSWGFHVRRPARTLSTEAIAVRSAEVAVIACTTGQVGNLRRDPGATLATAETAVPLLWDVSPSRSSLGNDLVPP